MLITNRNLTSVAAEIYYGNILFDVEKCTFSGVKLDRNLKFGNHINHLLHSGTGNVICIDREISTIDNGNNLSTIFRPGNMLQLHKI